MLKKKLNFVIDCETSGNGSKQRVINVGIVIGDNYGNVLERVEYNIKENIELARTYPVNEQYYLEKVLFLNNVKWISTTEWYHKFSELLFKYAPDYTLELWSYNANFDYRAITNDWKREHLISNRKLQQLDENWSCIWNASSLFFQRRSFQEFTRKYGYITPKGNVRSSAEVVHRYLTRDVSFIEEHTGLEDAKIEYDILCTLLKQRKKLDKEKSGGIWHKAQIEYDGICGWL